MLAVAQDLSDLGFSLVATGGTAQVLEQAGLTVRRVNKVTEGRPHIVDMIKNDEADFIVNTTEGRRAIEDSASIRASAEAHGVFYTTTLDSRRGNLYGIEVSRVKRQCGDFSICTGELAHD